MSFSDLGLVPELLRAVSDKGYTTPTPIQLKAMPAVFSGSDVLAGAQTGTGKTAGFILPILQKLKDGQGRTPRALVLTPTRELAAQVAESSRDYGKYLKLRTLVVFGGVSINPQIDALRRGCDILVATPGRLLDLAGQRAVDLRQVQVFVLDEADRMLDMGFIPDIKRVLKLLPPERQNLMFSATYTEEIRSLAARFLRDPQTIEVAPRNAAADRVEHQVYKVVKDHKRHLLVHLIQSLDWRQVLVFTRTKHGANRLTQHLESAGIEASAIHGNKSQAARTKALADFKQGRIAVLVATEVASRGLDIKELPLVLNYDLPHIPEDYVHRIGRTARAGLPGQAVSLVDRDEAPLLRDIERLLKRSLPITPMPEFEILATPAAAPRSPDREDGNRHDGSRYQGRRHGAANNNSGNSGHRQPGSQHHGGRHRQGQSKSSARGRA